MRYLILILSIFLIFACAATKEVTIKRADQFNADEAIKPHITIEELKGDNWEEVTSKPYPALGLVDFFLANKDFDADIRYVIVRYFLQYRMVVGYAYKFKGEVYIFQSDGVGGYEPAELEDEATDWWVEQFKGRFFGNDLEEC